MSDGVPAWAGLALELAVAAAYLAAAARRSPRGARWPAGRTGAFMAGLAVIALALDSGIAAYDDIPWVHMLQHALLMMLAPMLLALGAPVTLAMRTMSTVGRRRLRGILRDPAVRGLLTRPAVLLADYNVTMAVLLLAPPYRLAERNLVVHVAVHVYLLLCGLLFWTAMLARDPVPARVARDRRLRLVALCVPLNGAVAAWVVAVPGLTIGAGRSAALTAAGVLVAASAAASLLGVAVIRGNRLVPRPAAGTVAATASV